MSALCEDQKTAMFYSDLLMIIIHLINNRELKKLDIGSLSR
jgi:hypothetical protein